MVVHRIQNPAALSIPNIRRLFARALTTIPAEEGKKKWLETLQKDVAAPYWGLFVGVDGLTGRPFGVSAVRLPQDGLFDVPLQVAFCSEGTPQQRKSLVAATVQFIKAAGYNKLRATTDRSPAVFERFYNIGPSKSVATTVEFDLDA